MAYKTRYTLFIEELQKRIPNVLEGFEYEGKNLARYSSGCVYRQDYSFIYPYNECFEIELYPEKFYSKTMKVNRWHIVLWENIFCSDGYVVLKHDWLEDENEIPKKVEEYCNYISNLPDD